MIKIIAISAALLSCVAQTNNMGEKTRTVSSPGINAQSIYDFKVEGLESGTINFADFKG